VRNILIVDDEPLVRQLFRDAIEEEGHAVVEAEDAGAALHILRNQTVHLAILDIQMPGTNGLELLERIHKSWRHVPVILCSGLPKLFDEYAVWEAMDQIAGLFSKPGEVRGLLDCVARALRAPGAAAPAAPSPTPIGVL